MTDETSQGKDLGCNALLGSDLPGKEKMVRLLAALGVEMSIGGCGCCGSPWVTFSFNGQRIFDGDDATFNTADLPPNAAVERLAEGQSDSNSLLARD